jgi:hypothetical protein
MKGAGVRLDRQALGIIGRASVYRVLDGKAAVVSAGFSFARVRGFSVSEIAVRNRRYRKQGRSKLVGISNPAPYPPAQAALAAGLLGCRNSERPAAAGVGLQREAAGHGCLTQPRSLLGRQTTQGPGLCLPLAELPARLPSCHGSEHAACVRRWIRA